MSQNNFVIRYTGLLKSPASWAKVNRKLVQALFHDPNITIDFNPTRGFRWKSNFPINFEPPQHNYSPSKIDLELSFTFPPRLEEYVCDNVPLWNLCVYEASRLPDNWIQPLNQYCQNILVPSKHNYSLFEESGIDPDKLRILPYGYDAAKAEKFYQNDSTNSEKIQLVTIATPHHRKGLDLVENLAPLQRNKSTAWKIHSFYEPENDDSHYWEDEKILNRLQQKGFDVTIGTRTDREILSLLSSSDLCVQPSRSEGFGLVILESMAVGTPVVTSNWGGHLDFKGPGMITIKGRLREAKNCQYAQKNPRAQVFEPDLKELREKLRELINQRDSLIKLGKQARNTVQNWSWEDSANELLSLIKQSAGLKIE